MAVFRSLQGRERSVLPSSRKHAIVEVLRRSKSFLRVWEKQKARTENETKEERGGGEVTKTVMCTRSKCICDMWALWRNHKSTERGKN